MSNPADNFAFVDTAQSPDVALLHQHSYTDTRAFSGCAFGQTRSGVVEDHHYVDLAQTPDVALTFFTAVSDDPATDLGVVKADIFGNEISNQKRTGGIA